MDKKLKSVLADVFGVRESEITPQLTKDDLDTWDSLKQMDLVMSLERSYDIALEIGDIVNMTSVESIIRVLTEKGVSFEN